MNMSLGKLGRKVHLTQRALVQVLKELESWEEQPTASRRTLKRARAAETASCSTSAFGNVMQLHLPPGKWGGGANPSVAPSCNADVRVPA